MKTHSDKNFKILSTLNGNIEIKRLKKIIPVLSIEGTGPLCPIKMIPPNPKAYRYVKSVFQNDPVVVTSIYHDPSGKNAFFTHAMVGLTDLNRFGINSDGFVYSRGKEVTDNPIYGTRFEDLRNKTDTVFILRPFLTRKEMESAYYTNRLQLTSPSFLMKSSPYSRVRNSVSETAIFNPIYIKHGGGGASGAGGGADGSDHHGYTIDNDRQPNTSYKLAKLRRVRNIKLLKKIKNDMKYNKQKKFTDDTRNVLISIRSVDLENVYDKIADVIVNSEKIQDMDFYFEDLLQGLSNVIIVLKL